MIAFVRRHGEHWLLVAVPRLPLALLQGDDGIASAPHDPEGHGASGWTARGQLWTVF